MRDGFISNATVHAAALPCDGVAELHLRTAVHGIKAPSMKRGFYIVVSTAPSYNEGNNSDAYHAVDMDKTHVLLQIQDTYEQGLTVSHPYLKLEHRATNMSLHYTRITK